MIGIYKITNTKNGKVYIGQSWDIDRRIREHQLISQEHNDHLKRSILKYGVDNFCFEVLITFKDGPFTQKYLDKFEQYYIDIFDSIAPNKGYNKKGGGSHGKLSSETKRKLSKSKTGQFLSVVTKKKISESITIMLSDPSIRARISKANTGRKMTADNKRNLLRVNKGNQYSIKGCRCIETGRIYESIKDAIKDTGAIGIYNALRGNCPTAGGCHWEYVKNPATN